jgi:hypothetical protein
MGENNQLRVRSDAMKGRQEEKEVTACRELCCRPIWNRRVPSLCCRMFSCLTTKQRTFSATIVRNLS